MSPPGAEFPPVEAADDQRFGHCAEHGDQAKLRTTANGDRAPRS